jgi:glutamine cyclotransferase
MQAIFETPWNSTIGCRKGERFANPAAVRVLHRLLYSGPAKLTSTLPMTPDNRAISRRLSRETPSRRILCWVLVVLVVLRVASAWGESVPLVFQVLATKDHDRRIFTQGLVLNGKLMTESSGLYGKSFLVQYDVDSGAVLRRIGLPREYFAEGITEFNGRFYLLTWQAGRVLVFDARSLQQVATQPYQGEGWGIAHNGQHLITSNGSDTLSLRNAADFSVVDTLHVKDGDSPWHQLNELDYAEDLIWANVWQQPVILAIDPATGQVKGKADLSDLVKPNNSHPGQSVLNGIAYDPEQRAFWITGKWWAKRYLVRFEWPQVAPAPAANNLPPSSIP